MNRFIFYVAGFFAALCSAICSAQVSASSTTSESDFSKKALAAPHIRVENLSQFSKWNGEPIQTGDFKQPDFEKTRLGTVTYSPDLRVHIDVIRNLVHFPSYYELVDARTGATIGKYAVFDTNEAVWYFAGDGVAYINQQHLSLCGSRYTRKISQKGKNLVEVAQPLIYVGTEAEVQSTTQLFESPNSRTVVATVFAGTKVTVLGLLPDKTELYEMSFLVKTPLGLTGWHQPRNKPGDGRINIYQCN